jgi:hypothetical protein
MDCDKAEAELGWFFGRRASALGMGAQKYDSSGGGVWDEARIDGLHLAKRTLRYREELSLEQVVTPTVAKLPPWAFAVTEAAFASSNVWTPQLRSVFSLRRRERCLVAVAVNMPAARELFVRYVSDNEEPSSARLIEMLDNFAKTAKSAARLVNVRDEAADAWTRSLAEYEALRQTREQVAREAARVRREELYAYLRGRS